MKQKFCWNIPFYMMTLTNWLARQGCRFALCFAALCCKWIIDYDQA